jgi:predicted metal-binding membrane protein
MPISVQPRRRPSQRIDAAQFALIASLILLAALAWVVAGGMMEGMDTGPGGDLGSLSFYVAAWLVMMAAMMFPSISPMVRTYALVQRSRYARRGLGEPTAAIVAFIAGYLLIWIVFGLAAYATFKLAGAIDLVPFSWDRGGSYLAGGVILVSAIYQLTPLKDACLSRCRGPLDFLTERWRDGVAGALRLGLEHGAWCVGCCWALMAALFALGVMSIAWMTLIAALIAAEKLLPWKQPANRAIAVLLAVLGLAVAFVPASVPGLTLPGHAVMSMGHGSAVTGGMSVGGKKTLGMDKTAEKAPRAARPVMRSGTE